MEIYDFALYDTLEKMIPMLKNVYNIVPILGLREIETLEIYIISDSVIIIQKDITSKGFLYLLSISKIILGAAIAGGMPLRGGISLDEVSVIKNKYGTTILGKGLTKAYEIENSQSWAGAIVSNECFESLGPAEAARLSGHLCTTDKNILVRKYDVPSKNGVLEHMHVLNWTDYALIKNEEDVVNAFSNHNKSVESERTKIIIDNTVKFFTWMKKM